MVAVTVTYEVHIPTDIVMRLGHFSKDFIYKIHFREIIMYQYKDSPFICCHSHIKVQKLNHEYVAIVTRHFVRDGKSKSRTKKPPYGVSSETKQ
jgi:hypothetical protein